MVSLSVGGILAMKSQNIFVIITKLILGLILLAVALVLGPVLIIWALNTMFPTLAIPFTWETLLAAFILSTPFTGGIFRTIKK